MNIDGHASPVINHFERLIGMKNYLNFGGVSGQRFIDGVVDHFLPKVIGARGVGIHSRSATHWF
ncbi:Uncharacterised protein [Vibrio cholerae]|nr:Uncharacterised protein [Vibrio cholerae]CSI62823.1 Uncharacterised protein [Vibrio cholerae]